MKRMLGLWLWAVLACSAQPVPLLQPQFSDAQPGSEEWTGCWLGCSLACGLPWRVQASSTLAPQGSHRYDAEQTQDGRAETAWAEGAQGSGQGQWLECRFYGDAKHAVNLSGLSIASGYQKTPDSYLDNARPKSLKLVVNGATWAQLQLADSPRIQNFSLSDRSLRVGDRLRLVILEVYPGRKYDDCCITEFVLNGGH